MIKKRLKLLPKINAAIVVLSVLICIIYAVYYFMKSDIFMAMSSLVVIILPLLIYVIDRLTKWKIPNFIKTAYLLFLFESAILGAIGNFYGTVPLYDKWIHFTSGIIISWFFAIGFDLYRKHNKPNMGIFILFLTSFNTAIAAFWEISEFLFDIIFGKQVQRGLSDTINDMIVAVIGGIIITVIYILKYRKNKNAQNSL